MKELKEYEARGAKGCETISHERANMLLVGDRVNLFADQPGAAYGWGTVVCVTDKFAEVVRPYVHTADFTMTAGQGNSGQRIMDYIGQERVKLPLISSCIFSVVFRTTIPK